MKVELAREVLRVDLGPNEVVIEVADVGAPTSRGGPGEDNCPCASCTRPVDYGVVEVLQLGWDAAS